MKHMVFNGPGVKETMADDLTPRCKELVVRPFETAAKQCKKAGHFYNERLGLCFCKVHSRRT